MILQFLYVLLFGCVFGTREYIREWTVGNHPLPKRSSGLCPGYHNESNTIYLIGGEDELSRLHIWSMQLAYENGTVINNAFNVNHTIWNEYEWVDCRSEQSVVINDNIWHFDVGILSYFSMSNQSIQYNISSYTYDHYYREYPCLTRTLDNKYLIILGGQSSNGNSTRLMKIYDINRDLWFDGPLMNVPRYRSACEISKKNGYIYIFGGDIEGENLGIEKLNSFKIDEYISNLSLFVNNEWEWEQVEFSDQISKMADLSAVYHRANERIYLIGGYKYALHYFRTIYEFDISNDFIHPVTPLNTARSQAAALSIPFDDRLYVFGGESWNRKKLNSWEFTNTIVNVFFCIFCFYFIKNSFFFFFFLEF